MGVDRQDLAEPCIGRRRVRAKLSLHAGKARTPSGAHRAEAVTVVAALGNSSGNFMLPTPRAIQPARWPGGTGALLPRWTA